VNSPGYAKGTVEIRLKSRICHFEAGRQRDTLSRAAVTAVYPFPCTRSHHFTNPGNRTQSRFQRSLNDKPIPPEVLMTQPMGVAAYLTRKPKPVFQ